MKKPNMGNRKCRENYHKKKLKMHGTEKYLIQILLIKNMY